MYFIGENHAATISNSIVDKPMRKQNYTVQFLYKVSCDFIGVCHTVCIVRMHLNQFLHNICYQEAVLRGNLRPAAKAVRVGKGKASDWA